MANCNKLFLDFNTNISLLKKQVDALITSRKSIEKSVIKYFKDNTNLSVPKFWIQGSYVMKTLVIKKNGTYDVDLGVYFLEKPDVEAKTVQGYVKSALKDQTSSTPEHRQKCIRVIYAGDYNIDLPVYYKLDDDDHPFLAVKDNGWEESDPLDLKKWFIDKKDKNGQLCRLVKYLKVWADKLAFKAPSGIALSVWAAENFKENERDDVALLDLLKSIKQDIGEDCICLNPKSPFDDLTSKLDDVQKEKFIEALNNFINDAEYAIDSKNQLEASKKWRIHLGKDRFPEGKDEDVDSKQALLNATKGIVLGGNAKLNKEGVIQTEEGIPHKPHKNYGG